ncbi:MAG: Gfo/Idh/MocA family oxidoreductase [Gemmataceae bacterium]
MAEGIGRREFLAAAGSVGLASLAEGGPVAGGRAPAEKLVVAIMGTGGRGTQHATSFQREAGVEVAYVCDADMRRAEAAAAAVQKATGRSPRAVQDYHRILEDKAVNAVVIATPNHWHAPAAIECCAAGKHVYVEKPCSYTAREGELLVQAARKHKKQVQMGNQRRSWPAVIQAIEELHKGAIGRVYFAESWYQNNRPSIGRGRAVDPPKQLDYALWQGPAPRRPFHDNYLHYNWHWFWAWGNGELGNNGVHTIDLCRWGLGVDFPTRVISAGNRYRYEDDQQTPDTHIVSFEFEGRKMITWHGLSCSKQAGRSYHTLFHGERGTLALTDSSYVIYDVSGKETRREKVQGGDRTHIVNFLDSIRAGARLNSEIEEGHKSTLLCHLGNIAHRTGRTLRCDPKNGQIQGDKEAMAFWTREYEKGFEPRV